MAVVLSRRVRPCNGDCFVALRAPRNDGVWRWRRHFRRHCERSEAISRPMLAPMFDPAFRHHLSPRTCLLTVRERCRAAHPGGLSCQIVGFEPFASHSGAPKVAGRNADPSVCLTAVGALCRAGMAGISSRSVTEIKRAERNLW